MPTINIRPTAPCPCRSGWVSVSCCYDAEDKKFRKKVRPITPPGPITGYSHSACYLRGTRDCSTKISGEHYFSAAILQQIADLQEASKGAVRVKGMPWQQAGETQDLPISSLKANILCKRHNEALSPLDDEASHFFSVLNRIFSDFNQKRIYRKLLLDLVSGSAIEQWMLKVACGLYFSVAAKGTNKISYTHSIDLEKVEKALFENVWDDRGGMYFNGHTGSILTMGQDVSFTSLSDDHAQRFAGSRINLLGFEIDLLFDTTGADPRPWTALTRRPTELIFASPERKHHLLLSWSRGTPDSTLKFDAKI
jgi:hypothetical protein